jgi:hypothetical protein
VSKAFDRPFKRCLRASPLGAAFELPLARHSPSKDDLIMKGIPTPGDHHGDI